MNDTPVLSRKEEKALYYKANKEKISIRCAAWYAANKERRAVVGAAYRAANKEKIAIRGAAYYAANKEKRNKKKIAADNAAYRKANPDVIRRMSSRRRALKLANGFEIYTEQQVLEIYGTDCHICNLAIDLNAPRSSRKTGWESGLHIDHLIPLSKGGADTLNNVRPAHGLCNIKKGNR